MKAIELASRIAESPNSEIIVISKSGKRFAVNGVEYSQEDDKPVLIIRVEAQ